MEHLEGKNHKKKEAIAKNAAAHGGTAATMPRSLKHLYCELCDVVCTCSDTFAAHLRGTKHNKVPMLARYLLLVAGVHSVSTFAVVLLCTVLVHYW